MAPVHICDEDLELYLFDRLDAEASAAMDTHLRGCAACAIRASSSDIFLRHMVTQPVTVGSGPEKRRSLRIATDGDAVIQRINPFSTDRLQVRILDVSRDGMRVGSPYLLEPGSTVKIRIKNMIVFGEVRHSRMVGGAYHAGIHLDDGFQMPGA